LRFTSEADIHLSRGIEVGSTQTRAMCLVDLVLLGLFASSAALGCSCAVMETARLLGAPPTPEEAREDIISANTNKLRVTLVMDRQEYFPSQSAIVKLSVTNPESEPLEVWEPLQTNIFYVLPGGPGCWCGRSRLTRRLDGKEEIERIFQSGDKFVIPDKPGAYQLLWSFGGEAKFRVIAGELRLATTGVEGQGAILHGSHKVACADDPAVASEALEIYGTGFLFGCPAPRQLMIAGHPAEILYYGAQSPRQALDQINVVSPKDSLRDQHCPCDWYVATERATK
jgi:hypothetical protein